MEPNSPTKHHSFWSSAKCAVKGLRAAYESERNLRIDTLVSLLVGAGAAFLGLPFDQVPLVLIAVGLVASTELINTAVESVVDLVQPNAHPLAARAKDVAAAGVMVAAVFAAGVGAVVFAPLAVRFLTGPPSLSSNEIFVGSAFIVAALLFIAWWVVHPVSTTTSAPVPADGNREGDR